MLSSKTRNTHLRGTRANQPSAALVLPGTLYYITDEQKIERSTGIIWESYSSITTSIYTIGVSINGGGSVLTTGFKGYRFIPVNGTINRVTILADQNGDIEFDISKTDYSNFPTLLFTSITASAKPTLTGAQKYTDITLTGWDKDVSVEDILGFHINSVTNITKATLQLEIGL